MKYSLLYSRAVIIGFVMTGSIAHAQNGVTIGSSSAPASSAILDLHSNSKGFLPPRMSSLERKAINAPVAGLIVFDTDLSQLFLFDGSTWSPLVNGNSGNNLFPLPKYQPVPEQKATGYFGVDVDLSGDYAVVGAPRADIDGGVAGGGAVYVYRKSGIGGWGQVARLLPSDPQAAANFGGSVAIDGDYIVVGAPLYDNTSGIDAGRIYIFKRESENSWTQQAYFQGTAAYDYFGYNVDLSIATAGGTAIVVGTPGSDLNGTDRGAAYAYRLNGSTWQYLQTIVPGDRLNSDRFGWDVSLDSDYCAISAPQQDNSTYTDAGSVYVYVFGGGTWTFQQKLFIYTTGAQFGYGLTLKSSWLVIGAPLATPYSNSSAGVYVYTRSGATWTLKTTLYLLNNQGYDNTNRLGISVALDGGTMLISAPAGYLTHFNTSSYYYKAGYVFVYKLYGNSFSLEKVINDDSPIPPAFSNNFFGNAVSMDHGNYIIGSPGKIVNGVSAGAVVFGFIE